MANTPGKWHKARKRHRAGKRSPPRLHSSSGDRSGREEYALTDYGQELVSVVDVIEAWLAKAPQGAIAVLSDAASEKISALDAGYRSGFMSGSVEQPPPQLLDAGIAEELTGEDGSRRYELTDWGRQGIGVILAAARAEGRHRPGAVRLTPSELSGLMRMAMPLVELADDVEGVIEFGVDPDSDDPVSSAAGFWAKVEGGRIVATGEGPPPDR
jgi:hypothetical protein